jgi:dCMP deaminase
MSVATLTADLSYAERLKVGSVIVKNKRILSIGYNGMPAGWDNCCEAPVYSGDIKLKETVTRPEVIHAEANAILKLAASNESSVDAIMFITHAPCMSCAKLIYQSGIKQVIYKYSYRDRSGINFLKEAGVNILLYYDLLNNNKSIGVVKDE